MGRVNKHWEHCADLVYRGMDLLGSYAWSYCGLDSEFAQSRRGHCIDVHQGQGAGPHEVGID